MHPMVNIALRAARDASEALIQTSARLDRISVVNGDPLNFISSADQDSEATLIYHLQKAYPNHSFQSRVSETIIGDAGEPTWLIDPLVGSFDFSRGSQNYGITIACQIGGIITHAILVIPGLSEEFVSTRGTGAQLNNQRIRVVDDGKFEDPLIAIEVDSDSPKQLGRIVTAMKTGGALVRITGNSAIDMAYTAAGRISGGWCFNRSSLSHLALSLILTEAGALIGNETGSPQINNATELIFASPRTFKALVKLRQSLKL